MVQKPAQALDNQKVDHLIMAAASPASPQPHNHEQVLQSVEKNICKPAFCGKGYAMTRMVASWKLSSQVGATPSLLTHWLTSLTTSFMFCAASTLFWTANRNLTKIKCRVCIDFRVPTFALDVQRSTA